MWWYFFRRRCTWAAPIQKQWRVKTGGESGPLNCYGYWVPPPPVFVRDIYSVKTAATQLMLKGYNPPYSIAESALASGLSANTERYKRRNKMQLLDFGERSLVPRRDRKDGRLPLAVRASWSRRASASTALALVATEQVTCAIEFHPASAFQRRVYM